MITAIIAETAHIEATVIGDNGPLLHRCLFI